MLGGGGTSGHGSRIRTRWRMREMGSTFGRVCTSVAERTAARCDAHAAMGQDWPLEDVSAGVVLRRGARIQTQIQIRIQGARRRHKKDSAPKSACRAHICVSTLVYNIRSCSRSELPCLKKLRAECVKLLDHSPIAHCPGLCVNGGLVGSSPQEVEVVLCCEMAVTAAAKAAKRQAILR